MEYDRLVEDLLFALIAQYEPDILSKRANHAPIKHTEGKKRDFVLAVQLAILRKQAKGVSTACRKLKRENPADFSQSEGTLVRMYWQFRKDLGLDQYDSIFGMLADAIKNTDPKR